MAAQVRVKQPASNIFSCYLSFTSGIVSSMNAHEVYERAPVVLVALEVRHPMADPLTPAESRVIKKRLSKRFPLELPGQLTNFQITPAAAMQPDVTTERFPRSSIAPRRCR